MNIENFMKQKRHNTILCMFLLVLVVVCISLIAYLIFSMALTTYARNERICEGETVSVFGSLTPEWQIKLDGGAINVPVLSDGVGVVIDRTGESKIIGSPTVNDRLVGLDINSGDILWEFPPNSSNSLFQEKISVVSQYIGAELWSDQVVILSIYDGSVFSEFKIDPLEFLVTPNHLFFRDWTRATKVLELDSGIEVLHIDPKTIDTGNQFAYLDGMIYSLYGNEIRIYQDDPLELLFSGTLLTGGVPAEYPHKFMVFDEYVLVMFKNMNSTIALYRWKDQVDEMWSLESVLFDESLWPPVIDGNSAYLFSEVGRLTQVSLLDGQVLSSISSPADANPISSPGKHSNLIYAVYSDGSLRSFALPEMVETIELKSNRIRNYINEGYYWHFPGVTVYDDHLLVSFGCKTLYSYLITK